MRVRGTHPPPSLLVLPFQSYLSRLIYNSKKKFTISECSIGRCSEFPSGLLKPKGNNVKTSQTMTGRLLSMFFLQNSSRSPEIPPPKLRCSQRREAA